MKSLKGNPSPSEIANFLQDRSLPFSCLSFFFPFNYTEKKKLPSFECSRLNYKFERPATEDVT